MNTPSEQPAAAAPEYAASKVVSGRGTVAHIAAILFLLAIAAGLRLFNLDKQEIWLDEAFSVLVALSPEGVIRELLRDNNPPLYFLLLKAWVRLFGIEPTAVRTLSALVGLAQLGALVLWLRSLGYERRVRFWAAALGAVAPLHIYYSQETRPYTLLWLLITLACWTFTRAARNDTWGAWLLHGASLLAALYTHLIALFFVPAFFVAGWSLRIRAGAWRRMFVAHGAALALIAPWMLLTLSTWGAGSGHWIADLVAKWPAAGLISRTLALLGLATRPPDYLRMGSPPPLFRMLWYLVLTLIVLRIALCVAQGIRHKIGDWRPTLVLVWWTLLPLALLLAVNLLLRPIYLLGRYDTLVYPAYLGLFGLGLTRVEFDLAVPLKPIGARLAMLLIFIGLAAGTLLPHLIALDSNVINYPQRMRADLLETAAWSSDLVVCTGLETAPVAYEIMRRGLRLEVASFPHSAREHLGWFWFESVMRNRAELIDDANLIATAARGGQGSPRRVWLVYDPRRTHADAGASVDGEETARHALVGVVRASLLKNGFRLRDNADTRALGALLGIELYE